MVILRIEKGSGCRVEDMLYTFYTRLGWVYGLGLSLLTLMGVYILSFCKRLTEIQAQLAITRA